MEPLPAFDLNRAIQDWRTGLSKSPALQRDNLDELESHLRDSIATLTEKGLSEEEALLVAVHRCGTQKQLQTEFSKFRVIESLFHMWFFRTVGILLGFLTLINGYSFWHGAAKARDVYRLWGLGVPSFMIVVLAITGLVTLQLRYLARVRGQNSILPVVYWLLIFVFSGSLLLAVNGSFDIFCGALLSANVDSPNVPQAFSRHTGFSIEGFWLAQLLILVLLLAISATSTFLRKIRAGYA